MEEEEELTQTHGSMIRSKRSFAISSGRLQLSRHNLRYEAFKFCRSAKLSLQKQLVTQLHFSKAETNQRPPAK